MGYKSPHVYTLSLGCNDGTPNDSTTYYAGYYGWSIQTTDYFKIYVPKKGVIRACVFEFFSAGVQGTNEDIVMKIGVNATTYTTIATVGIADIYRLFANYSMNIPVEQGDFLSIQFITPAWVDNPTGVRISGHALIECE